MAEIFGVDDFELIMTTVKNKDRKKLCKRLYAEWKERWSAYLKHLKENEQKGLLRRIEKRSEDHHGVETKKFLKWIFKTEKYGDYDVQALLLIFITGRMRTMLQNHIKSFGRGSRVCKGLEWIIHEWKDQARGMKHFDSLTVALTYHEYHPMHIAWAINSHARRMRVGADRTDSPDDPEGKVRISKKLMDLAEGHLERAEHDPEIIEQFCIIPASVDVFKVYFHGQRMLNMTRKGSQRKSVDMAVEQRKLINEAAKNNSNSQGFDWPKFLEWWTWYVEIRAASSSMDMEKFGAARTGLDKIERDVKGKLEDYFKINQKDRFTLKLPSNIHKGSPLRYILFEVVKRWRDFYDRENFKDKECEEYRRFCWASPEFRRRTGAPPSLGFPEMHEAILGEKWKSSTASTAYRHPFAPFQQFVIARPMDAKKRAEVMLKEIEMVRSFSPQCAGDLSCLVMEILYRELLYRLWYEIKKMKENDPHGVDVEFAIRILERIKSDIERLRAYPKEGHEAIDKTVNILRNHCGEAAGEFTKTLRTHLHDQFETSNRGRGKQCFFLGIPYAHDGDNFSRIMHSFSHILEKKSQLEWAESFTTL